MQVKGTIDYVRGKQIGLDPAGNKRGWNSEVFLIDEPQLGGRMVVKEIRKAAFPNANYFDEAQRMFATHHPNVVPIQYACDTALGACGDPVVSLVMRFFKKGSLADLLDKGPVPVNDLLSLATRSLLGVGYIHSKGMLHLDLKPSNIMISDTGEPMVADFGQARELNAAGTVKFPPLYPTAIPPEAHQGLPAAVDSDLYHFGLLLYRAVNGNVLFKSQVPPTQHDLARATLSGKFPNRKEFLPHVPPRLRTIIRKALSVDRTRRYQSASELSKELGRINPTPNWTVRFAANGAISWSAARQGRPTIQVDLSPNGPLYDVSMHTTSVTGRRALRRADHRRDISRADAFSHLTTVFQTLV